MGLPYQRPLYLCLAALLASSAVRASHAADAPPAVTVEPMQGTIDGNLGRLQLLVTATASDGRQSDLTRTADYENLTPDILQITPTGLVAPVADGGGKLRVRHGASAIDVNIDVKNIRPQAGEAGLKPPSAADVSFRHDVIPVLNKAGCSQGACHAAQYGKGGLKLSLLGYAPEQDHAPIVRDDQQRRISLVRPEDSLILRKATMQVGHGGGKRFETDSYEHEILRAWVAAGVPAPLPQNQDLEVVDLTITPLEHLYRLDESQQLRVVAHYSDGSTRDVTHRSQYDSLGDGVAKVDAEGLVTAVGHGQAAVMIRYLGQAKVSHVVAPFRESVDLAGFTPNNFVDEKVKARWQRLGLRPAELASDEVFIRRAFVDAIGTLPRPDVVERFLASTDPRKRETLIDEILGLTGDPARDLYVEAWSAYWTLKWGDLVRTNSNKLGAGGMWSLANWMRNSFRENKPMDQFVREIITAQGSIYQSGPANYYRIAGTPEDLAEATAQIFLGVRLQCARCHHHPFEVYSQGDYYGLAAFFTRVGTKSSTDFGPLGADQVVMLKDAGSIRHPRTGETMRPTPLLAKPVEGDDIRDLRRPLAEWLTSPENKLFARNIVNRTWGYFMGTGLVEPIDDMRATNPASNPELLDALADDFVAGGFDLRKLMRSIMVSRVYQLSSTPLPENVADTRFYLHYNVKRLTAEVLLDAIDFACETQERFNGVPAGTRAIELPDPNYGSYFLDTLGRPKRVITCECERTSEPNLAQVLHIANGEVVNRKLTDKDGRISRLISANATDDVAIREFYVATLCRPPHEDEVAKCRQIIEQASDRREGLEDVLWALINSREFLFNH